MHKSFSFLPFFLMLFVVLTISCIERKFIIITNPATVNIYIDGEFVGKSEESEDPEVGICELSFDHYGSREIVLTKKDFETRREFIDPSIPWFEIFPIDFITDVLNPFTINSEFVYRFDLHAYEEVDSESLFKQGKILRKYAKNNLIKPRIRD